MNILPDMKPLLQFIINSYKEGEYMSIIIIMILGIAVCYLIYELQKKNKRIKKMEYELKRLMNLVNEATNQGFKL